LKQNALNKQKEEAVAMDLSLGEWERALHKAFTALCS